VAALELLADALRDRYVLERELGRGGMATVYLAHDLKHDRRVALKVLHPELAATLGPERFLREIRTTARLEHPHILPLLDSGKTAGQLWYTMPYVQGESLRDRLRREVQLPVDEAVRLTREVAEALDCAHRSGVVHRDVKPENILLSEGHARVADFGIARALETAGASQLTETGLAIGTPTYMSPEQASGGQAGARSDVYALGCVIYEMLAGEPPYTGPTLQATIAKRFLGPPPSLRAVRPSVSESVEYGVLRALAPVPADRFATAGEFARTLEQAQATPATALSTQTRAARARTGIPRLSLLAAAVLALVLLGLVLGRGRTGEVRSPGSGPKMLAVLPFENVGRPEDEYFAEGLTDEITSRLAAVANLGVISRTSAMQYKSTRKPLRQIGRELGAAYVLEGSVRWEKRPDGTSRVRVTPQLVQVSDDRHLWAERYDADLADVFDVQGHIAEQVTSALDVALRAPERQALAVRPTTNLHAYDAYLRGSASVGRSEAGDEDFHLGVRLFEKAVELDPRFALAHAALSRAHSWLYWRDYDHSDERLARAKAAADQALRLAPDLPEGHLALGYYYYWGHRDYARALTEFALAKARLPSSSEAIAGIGVVERRQGHWDSAASHLRRAAEIDPRSRTSALMVGETYDFLRDYGAAERYYKRAIALTPDWAVPHANRAWLYVRWHGDPARARQAIREALPRTDVAQLVSLFAFNLNSGSTFVIAEGDLSATFERLSLSQWLGSWGSDTSGYYLWKADWHRLRGESELGRDYGDSARGTLEVQVRVRPEDDEAHGRLGLAYAWLGYKARAIREGKRAVELLPMDKDAVKGTQHLLRLARIYTLVGEQDAALEQLERLLSVPSLVSRLSLRVDPEWKTLRRNPRFQRLVD
jgi:serine/threonine protein kinase/tetratricopeptide (TPR) repeat protein